VNVEHCANFSLFISSGGKRQSFFPIKQDFFALDWKLFSDDGRQPNAYNAVEANIISEVTTLLATWHVFCPFKWAANGRV
jgi:hypothetical protein